MTEEILTLYRRRFQFTNFYHRLLYNISADPAHHISSNNFLFGIKVMEVFESIPCIMTQDGDVRVDLPVWFGDPNSTNKIVVVGLEPRDTDKSGQLNIERTGKFVFATRLL